MWKEQACNAAFIQLAGQEGVTDARLTEIPPGKSLSPSKFAIDELVYVLEGRGLVLIPFNCTRQFSNMQGNKPARLLPYTGGV